VSITAPKTNSTITAVVFLLEIKPITPSRRSKAPAVAKNKSIKAEKLKPTKKQKTPKEIRPEALTPSAEKAVCFWI